MAKSVYKELAFAPIEGNREIVISEFSDGGFTLAQRINVQEGERQTSVYMKNSIHVPTMEALVNLRDAINTAIETF